jgi:hypothetical protein
MEYTHCELSTYGLQGLQASVKQHHRAFPSTASDACTGIVVVQASKQAFYAFVQNMGSCRSTMRDQKQLLALQDLSGMLSCHGLQLTSSYMHFICIPACISTVECCSAPCTATQWYAHDLASSRFGRVYCCAQLVEHTPLLLFAAGCWARATCAGRHPQPQTSICKASCSQQSQVSTVAGTKQGRLVDSTAAAD